jgi:hypothetical protein
MCFARQGFIYATVWKKQAADFVYKLLFYILNMVMTDCF